jgi:gliding motility-associated-like protein
MAVRVLAPTGGRPYAHDVVVDAAGNSYVSGQYNGSVRFDARTLTAASGDTYIAKIDAAGNYRWIVTLNTGFYGGASGTGINASSLAIDGSGNVYIAGIFATPTLALGSTTLINSGAGPDLFVGKLDPNGNWLSAVRAGGLGTESVHGIAVDGGGNAYVTGSFTGTASFGGSVITARRAQDAFVARLDAGGAWRWAVPGNGSGDDAGDGIGVDANGHVYVAGTRMALGGPSGTSPILSGLFIYRLDVLTGAYQRSTTIATGRFYYGRLAVDAAGACYLAGCYQGSLTFGAYTLASIGMGVSNENVCVAKLDAAGTWQWARAAGGYYGTYCSGIAIDDRGGTYLAGSFRGPSQFGAVTLTSQNIALLWNDAYVAKLDAAGTWLWAVPAGGGKEDVSTGFALGPAATPYLVGEHRSPSMAFGNLTIPGEANELQSTYVARLQANRVFIAGDSVLCNGGRTQLTASTFGAVASWRWNTGATSASITVSQPGTYTATVTFPGGYSVSETYRVRSIVPPPVAVTGTAGFLCPGTPRQLTAVAAGAVGWRWSTGATTPGISVTQPGTYTVTAIFSSACTATAQAMVAGNEVQIGGRLQLCPGQSTTLTATATGAAVTGYRWNTGATTPTLLVGQAGTFQVTATFADGCQRTATHTVGPPVAEVASVSGDTILCRGTTLTLTALNPDAIAYRWNTGATTPTISVTQPGTYGVVLSYTGGCTSRDSLRVLPAPVLPAALTLGRDTTLCEEQPLLLRVPAIAGPGVSWRWSDGSTGPTLAVREAGTYSLLIRTPCDSLALRRRVGYASCLLIPNVITPNGDRQNDQFVIQNMTSGDWDLTLYNRWGRQVYHTNAYRQEWGKDAPAGNYYYLLRHPATNVSYKGWLEVIR